MFRARCKKRAELLAYGGGGGGVGGRGGGWGGKGAAIRIRKGEASITHC